MPPLLLVAASQVQKLTQQALQQPYRVGMDAGTELLLFAAIERWLSQHLDPQGPTVSSEAGPQLPAAAMQL